MTTHPRCTDCRKPMRHRKQPKTDHPGTVIHGGHGVCKYCIHRRTLAKQPRTDNHDDPQTIHDRANTKTFIQRIRKGRT